MNWLNSLFGGAQQQPSYQPTAFGASPSMGMPQQTTDYGGVGTDSKFTTDQYGMTAEEYDAMMKDKISPMQQYGMTSGLGFAQAPQAQSTPISGLMGMAMSGAGQQPYQDFMQGGQHPYIRGLMGV